jgi:hypothetical protein
MRQHLVIRREQYVAGTRERPESPRPQPASAILY